MIIQVNKHYINAIGDVISIISIINKNEIFKIKGKVYNGKLSQSFTMEGRYFRYTTSDRDLICECVPDILAYYTANVITQKEFIQQHIEYWNKNESIIN